MIHFIRWSPVVAMVVLLSGCADFTKQSYKSSAAAPIKKVLIATQTDFPKADFGVDSKMAMMGLVGTTISLSTVDGQTQTLDEILADQGPRYHQQFLADLTSALGAAGISAQTVAVEKNAGTGLADNYQSLVSGKNVDAILDIQILQAGYGDAHLARDPGVRPILRVRARLVSARDFKTLYADDISFGYINSLQDAKGIKAPGKYYFQDTQLVLFEKKKAAEGLRVAATEVARFLIGQFTNQSIASAR